MRIRQETTKSVDHPTVWNRLKRLEFNCSYCPPHKMENKQNHKKYGVRKPRIKQRNRRTDK